jgi:hypothetical protein
MQDGMIWLRVGCVSWYVACSGQSAPAGMSLQLLAGVLCWATHQVPGMQQRDLCHRAEKGKG